MWPEIEVRGYGFREGYVGCQGVGQGWVADMFLEIDWAWRGQNNRSKDSEKAQN